MESYNLLEEIEGSIARWSMRKICYARGARPRYHRGQEYSQEEGATNAIEHEKNRENPTLPIRIRFEQT